MLYVPTTRIFSPIVDPGRFYISEKLINIHEDCVLRMCGRVEASLAVCGAMRLPFLDGIPLIYLSRRNIKSWSVVYLPSDLSSLPSPSSIAMSISEAAPPFVKLNLPPAEEYRKRKVALISGISPWSSLFVVRRVLIIARYHRSGWIIPVNLSSRGFFNQAHLTRLARNSC
jgi:hypothetical protein